MSRRADSPLESGSRQSSELPPAVIPAIDLLGEEAVRLHQGRFDAVTWRLPVEKCVSQVVGYGAPLVHLVDLNGARYGHVSPDRLAGLVQMLAPSKVQVSGGIRSLEDAWAVLEAGASRVCIGTAAFGGEGGLERLAGDLADRLVVSIDVRDGQVAVAGWLSDTGITVNEAMSRCADAGVRRVSCTAIRRDGSMSGPDLDLLGAVCSFGLPVLAAGGVRGIDDVEAVVATGCEAAIVGTALLSGRIASLLPGPHPAGREAGRP